MVTLGGCAAVVWRSYGGRVVARQCKPVRYVVIIGWEMMSTSAWRNHLLELHGPRLGRTAEASTEPLTEGTAKGSMESMA